MAKWFDANGIDVDAYPDRAFRGGVYDHEHKRQAQSRLACQCEFCKPCPKCSHRQDEHLAGDVKAGICFTCQKEGKECGS